MLPLALAAGLSQLGIGAAGLGLAGLDDSGNWSLSNIFSGARDLLFGSTEQIQPEYTTQQQQLSNQAWASGQSVLAGLGTDISNLSSNYQSYLSSLAGRDIFGEATSNQAMSGYATTIDQILSGYSGSLLAQAESEGQRAASQAAESYNLAGAGGLYSGAAASAIAEGAARPITEAYTNIAGRQADLYSSLIGANVNSLSQILGYEVTGAGNLYNTGVQAATSQAQSLASLYGAQAQSYDTEPVFQQNQGALDYILAALPMAEFFM